MNYYNMKFKLLEKILQWHFNKNADYYISIGYKVKYNNNIFEITFNNSIYHLQLIRYNKKLYLKLTPYSTSYFKTEITLKELKFKVDMALFALKENEKVLKHEKQNNSQQKIKKDNYTELF